MTTRRIGLDSLAENTVPPAERIVRAKRLVAEAVAELVSAHVSQGVVSTEWLDQDTSPLGRRRHLELVRTGVLPGKKEGRRVLVRRADLDAYLAVTPKSTPDDAKPEEQTLDDVVRRILAGAK